MYMCLQTLHVDTHTHTHACTNTQNGTHKITHTHASTHHGHTHTYKHRHTHTHTQSHGSPSNMSPLLADVVSAWSRPLQNITNKQQPHAVHTAAEQLTRAGRPSLPGPRPCEPGSLPGSNQHEPGHSYGHAQGPVRCVAALAGWLSVPSHAAGCLFTLDLISPDTGPSDPPPLPFPPAPADRVNPSSLAGRRVHRAPCLL